MLVEKSEEKDKAADLRERGSVILKEVRCAADNPVQDGSSGRLL